MPNTYSTLGSLFTAIANAIRAKTGSAASIVADNFPTEIANIPSGGGSTLITKNITANGTYDAQDDNADGYSSVAVNVPSSVEVITSAGSSSINAISNGISYFAQNDSPNDSYKTYHGQFYSNATTPLSLNLSSVSSWRYVFKIRITDDASRTRGIYGNPNNDSTAYGPFCQINASRKLGCGFSTTTAYDWAKWLTSDDMILSLNTWYYVVQGWNNGKGYLILYDENGNAVAGTCADVTNWNNHNFNVVYGGSKGNSNNNWLFSNGEINLNESLIEVDGTCVWGATNSKTANMKANFTNPAEFTKVDWLGSTGTQYINTGFNPTNATRIKLTAKVNASQDDVHLFGARQSFGNKMFAIFVKGDLTKFRSDYGSTAGDETAFTQGDIISIDKNANITTVNGVTVSASSQTFSTPYPLYLHQWNNGGSILSVTNDKMIGLCELYDGLTMVRNMISCYHTVTGVKGMFDAENNKFYINAGSGDFSIPSDTSNEINLAEYLSSLT